MADTQAGATPHFKNPPVVETVLGVQFAPLKNMRVTHYGLLLPHLREVFSTPNEQLTKVSEQPPLEPVIEGFDGGALRPPSVQWSLSPAPPLPRCWYTSEDEQFLIQVQPDRLILNWRRQQDPSGEYPRYAAILDRFLKVYAVFCRFVENDENESSGRVQPNQCEVTYVNHIDLPDGQNMAETLDKTLMGWKLATSDGWLTGAEHGEFAASYVIPEKCGRLHIKAQRAVRRADSREIIRLSLTARGAPPTPDTDGIHQWLDIGHEWVVRGFASLTSPELHKKWGRIT